jgi:hypothetical protein
MGERTGSTDADDLARMLADDADIDVRRQAIASRHVLNTPAPVQLALARVAGLTEQMAIELRFITRTLGGDLR